MSCPPAESCRLYEVRSSDRCQPVDHTSDRQPTSTRYQVDCLNSSFTVRAESEQKSEPNVELITMLCRICSSILRDQVGLIRREPTYLLFSHHATASDLRSSVSQGCYICRAFCNEIFNSDQGFLMSEDLTQLVTHCQLSQRETVLSITVPNSYNLMIMLAEDTNIPNLATRKGTGTIFVLQPSLGQFFRA